MSPVCQTWVGLYYFGAFETAVSGPWYMRVRYDCDKPLIARRQPVYGSSSNHGPGLIQISRYTTRLQTPFPNSLRFDAIFNQRFLLANLPFHPKSFRHSSEITFPTSCSFPLTHSRVCHFAPWFRHTHTPTICATVVIYLLVERDLSGDFFRPRNSAVLERFYPEHSAVSDIGLPGEKRRTIQSRNEINPRRNGNFPNDAMES